MTDITMQRQGSWATILAVAALASCGGSSGAHSDGEAGGDASAGGDGASCGMVTPCGGAVVGRWTITDSCVMASLDLSSSCAGATATLAASFSGSATYNADLTYTQTGSTGGTVAYHFPMSCIGTQTCAQVRTALLSAGSAMAMGMTFQSASCATEGTGCVCDAVLASSPANEAGTYSTSGGALTTVHTGTTDTANYCVSGDVMHQMPSAGAALTGAIVLTKS